jgi:hypothetical protein
MGTGIFGQSSFKALCCELQTFSIFDIKLFQGGLLSFPPLPRWFELPLNTDFTKVVPGLLFPVHLLTKGYLNLTSIKSEGGDVCIRGECGGASAFTFSAYAIS